jgi:hypothetical protein
LLKKIVKYFEHIDIPVIFILIRQIGIFFALLAFSDSLGQAVQVWVEPGSVVPTQGVERL